jgi:hypothetical protein
MLPQRCGQAEPEERGRQRGRVEPCVVVLHLPILTSFVMSFLNANRSMTRIWGQLLKADSASTRLADGYRTARQLKVGGTSTGRKTAALASFTNAVRGDIKAHKTSWAIGGGIGAAVGAVGGYRSGDSTGGSIFKGTVGAIAGSAAGSVIGLGVHSGTLYNNVGRYAGNSAKNFATARATNAYRGYESGKGFSGSMKGLGKGLAGYNGPSF